MFSVIYENTEFYFCANERKELLNLQDLEKYKETILLKGAMMNRGDFLDTLKKKGLNFTEDKANESLNNAFNYGSLNFISSYLKYYKIDCDEYKDKIEGLIERVFSTGRPADVDSLVNLGFFNRQSIGLTHLCSSLKCNNLDVFKYTVKEVKLDEEDLTFLFLLAIEKKHMII